MPSLAFLSNALAVSLQFFKGSVLDFAVAGKEKQAAYSAFLLVAFIFGEILAYFSYRLFSAKFVVGCSKSLKHDIFESILRRSYPVFRERPQGEYIAKYTNEADAIKERRFGMLPVFWDITGKIAFVSAALFILDWRVALITIALLTTPLYAPKIIEKKLQKAQLDHIRAVETNLTRVNDWLAGFEIIKNYSIENKIMERFKAANEGAMEKLLVDTQLSAIAQLISTLISYLSYFTLLVIATWLVLNGDFTAGDFFIAIGMIDQLSYPLISLAGVIRQLLAIKPTCTAMEDFLATPPTVMKGVKRLNSGVRFLKVTFAYPGQPAIFDQFSLWIEKDKRYLVQGPSGSGKTTLINLLLGYYVADVGRIEIDGIPLQGIDPYSSMTVVRQEAILFNDTLRNNLSLYRECPTKNW